MTKTNDKPNIFNYATKELSQDAVICWLIAWADRKDAEGKEDKALHKCGRQFVEALLAEHEAPLDGAIKEVKILKQHKIPKQRNRIDVLARINDCQVLLIEDKIDTGVHGTQLEDYYKAVVEGKTGLGKVCKETLFPIFLKTGNQSLADDKGIEKSMEPGKSYKVFNRQEFLEVLKPYEGRNSILLDFRAHLQVWEDDTNSFKNWKKGERTKWSWKAWEGFFRYLEAEEKLVNCEGWHYVPNQQGGFLGLWWSGNEIKKGNIKEGSLYLQLEVVPEKPDEQKLCFKVKVDNKENRSVMRNKWHKWCMAAAEVAGIEASKPIRFGTGEHMTVVQWGKEEEKKNWLAFDSDDKLDKEATVANLKKAEAVLVKAIEMEKRQGDETQS